MLYDTCLTPNPRGAGDAEDGGKSMKIYKDTLIAWRIRDAD